MPPLLRTLYSPALLRPVMWEDEFTGNELEVVTSVFKQYETGLREGRIDAEVGGWPVGFCMQTFLYAKGPFVSSAQLNK